MTTATHNPLSYLHDQIEDLKAKGLHFIVKSLILCDRF